jgi:uncharacterized protein (TIGR02466 family)
MTSRISFTVSGPPAGPQPEPRPQGFDLFPTRIWQARLRALADRLPDWIGRIEALRAASPQPAGRTNRGGWNSAELTLLDAAGFADLRAALLEQCRPVLGEMGLDEAAQAAVQLQSWANIHDRGGFNFLHLHEGCVLSGCFYLQVPQGSGGLLLRDPRPGVLHGSLKGAVANGYRDVRLQPEPCLLVMFPSWLEHFVEVHDSDTPRISIAFNLVR